MKRRRNRPLTWQEIAYGLIIIGIILAWMIFGGGGGTPAEDRWQ